MTSHLDTSTGVPTPSSRVHDISAAYLRDRLAGHRTSCSDVLNAHPDLDAELAPALSAVELILSARSRAGESATAPAASNADRTPPPPEPTGLPGYEFIRELQRGGQGIVFDAIQLATGRRVAVKLRREGYFGDPREAERFAREVEALAQLDHPHIVRILDSGVREGRFFYAMDLVDGEPIDRALKERSVKDRLLAFEKVVGAVTAAHQRGFIHRDLKPDNILIDSKGEPHLLDFGLVRLQEAPNASSGFTHTGQFVGTLPWSSPEQAEGCQDRIDVRSDVYSLGVILFQLLTGRLPFDLAGPLLESLRTIRERPPPRPTHLDRSIDADLETIILKCLAKEPDQRYQSAAALGEDVRRFLEDQPILAHPPSAFYQFRKFAARNGLAVSAAAVVLAAIVIGLVTTSAQLFRARRAEVRAQSRQAEAEASAYVANLAAADSALRVTDSPSASTRLAAASPSLRGWEWRHLSALASRGVEVPDAPRVYGTLSATGNGGVIIGSFVDKTLQAWDPDSLKLRWKEQRAGPVAISGDGRLMLVGDGDACSVMNPETGKVIGTLSVSIPGSSAIPLGRGLNKNGSRVAVTYRGPFSVRILDAASGKELASQLLTEAAWLFGVAFTADDRFIVVDDGKSLLICDGTTAKEVRRLRYANTRSNAYYPLAVSPDGLWIATAAGSDIIVFSTTDWSRRTFQGHSQLVNCLVFDASGRQLISGGMDSSVRVWDVATGAERQKLASADFRIDSVCFARSGKSAMVTVYENGARTFDLTQNPVVDSFTFAPDQAGEIGVVAFSADSSMLTATKGHEVARWSLADRRLDIVQGKWEDAHWIWPAFSPDRQHILTLQPVPDRFEIYKLGLWRIGEDKPTWTSSEQFTKGSAFAISPDGQFAVSVFKRSFIQLWDASSGRQIREVKTGQAHSHGISFHPQSEFLVSGSMDGTAEVWSFPELNPLTTFSGHKGEVTTVQVSPDGKRVASCSRDKTVRIWDPRTGGELLVLAGHLGTSWAAAFSPDGSRIATGGSDYTVRIWDAGTGRELLQLRGHLGTVFGVAWSPDGRYLASCGADKRVLLWDSTASHVGSTERLK